MSKLMMGESPLNSSRLTVEDLVESSRRLFEGDETTDLIFDLLKRHNRSTARHFDDESRTEFHLTH